MGRLGTGEVAAEPAVDVEVIELLVPQQSGEALALDAARVLVHAG